MGHRANLLLVDESGYELYYCHWCATSLVHALFWGPEFAVRYIRQTQQTNEWLNTVWAEGGAVLDTHRKRLLLYGGEDVLFDIPLRRVYLELLELMWEGWQVEWAYDGIVDMAAYVGYPGEKVLQPPLDFSSGSITLPPPQEPDWINTIASIRLEDGTIRIMPLELMLDSILPYGEHLVSALKRDAELEQFSLASTGASFPTGGLHIDEGEKTLFFWSAYEDNLLKRIESDWEGWKIEWLKDNYETHIALTENRIKLETPSTEELLSSLKSIMLRESTSYVDTFLDILKHHPKKGYTGTINPDALQDNPQQVAVEIRERMFDEVVARWKERKQ